MSSRRGPRWTVLAAFLLLGLITPPANFAAAREPVQPDPVAAAAQQQAGPDWHDRDHSNGFLRKQIRRMTLEEKVGQLFVTYVYGQTADTTVATDVSRNRAVHGADVDNAKALVEKYHLGGIIYFGWSNNLANPRQIAELSNGIQQTATSQRVPIPLLISTDQEQGVVFRAPITQMPGSMALGAGRKLLDAYSAASITGRELRALGINQDYAPIADVNINALNPVIGVRSFGADPWLVAQLTAAQVIGFEQRDGVTSTAKHFPGHGNTNVDSHTGVPVINHSRKEWERIDLPPFRAAIASGIDSIMTAHIVVPALDPSGDPATLSHPIMTGILRRELRYDGVIVTDSLAMKGVRDKYGDDRVPVLAIKAGVDMLLMPPNTELAYRSVLDAVRSGEISERRIDESVYRILRMKSQRGIYSKPYVDPERIDSVVSTPAHVTEARRITNNTTTLVKNDAGLLPLSRSARNVLVTGWGVSTTATLAGHLTERGATTEVYETSTSPTQAKIDTAVAKAAASDLVVVTSNNAWSPGGQQQQQLVQALVATGTPVIVLGVRDPYDIAHFAAAPTYLATYAYTALALEAAVKVLFGELSPKGRLPVTIPVAGQPNVTLYPYGHGLEYQ